MVCGVICISIDWKIVVSVSFLSLTNSKTVASTLEDIRLDEWNYQQKKKKKKKGNN